MLSRTTVALMTSDHLGARIAAPVTPSELLLGTPGYTFGLGFAVRQGAGVPAYRELGGRIHVGRLRGHLLLGRSEGGTCCGVHEPSAQSGAGLLSKAHQTIGLCGESLKFCEIQVNLIGSAPRSQPDSEQAA